MIVEHDIRSAVNARARLLVTELITSSCPISNLSCSRQSESASLGIAASGAGKRGEGAGDLSGDQQNAQSPAKTQRCVLLEIMA
jgi:hypothetical protein